MLRQPLLPQNRPGHHHPAQKWCELPVLRHGYPLPSLPWQSERFLYSVRYTMAIPSQEQCYTVNMSQNGNRVHEPTNTLARVVNPRVCHLSLSMLAGHNKPPKEGGQMRKQALPSDSRSHVAKLSQREKKNKKKSVV